MLAMRVKPPQAFSEEIRPLSPEEVKMLFSAAQGNRLEALYVLAVHTGLKQGELLALKWDDVDLESGMLQVRRTLVRTKAGPVLAAPKTRSSRRSVKLTESATVGLRSHLERQRREIEGLGPAGRRTGNSHFRDRGAFRPPPHHPPLSEAP